MPDPSICQVCRKESNYGNYYVGDFNEWSCPAKAIIRDSGTGTIIRKHGAIAKEAAPPKGCRKLFEQLIARSANARP
jgi:hypothetical protein